MARGLAHMQKLSCSLAHTQKKVVDIIQRLADNPLKKPEHPENDEDSSGYQMKTRMLELTIFKIGTLLQQGFGELGAKIISK